MRLTPKGLAALAIATVVASLGCDGLFGVSDDRVKALEKEVQDLKTSFNKTGSTGSGRFQIVNPFPTYLRNTMLLDTVTGKTWIYCNLTDNYGKSTSDTGWCDMGQADGREDLK